MADLVLTYTPTQSDVRRSLRLTIGRTILHQRLAGLAAVVVALPALAAGEPGPWLTGFVSAAVGIGLFVRSFLLPMAVASRLPARTYKPRTCEIGPDGLRVSTDLTSGQWSWQAFRRATRTADFWVLRGEPGEQPIALPLRAFSPEQESRFVGYLTEHGLLAAGPPAAAPQPVPPDPRP